MTWEKEKEGLANTSVSARNIHVYPHSPEEEENMQKLLEYLRPLIMQGVQEEINVYFQEGDQAGDIIQHVYNIINNYFRNISYTLGQFLKPGKGIEFDWPGSGKSAINVRAGKGLEAAVESDLNVELTTDGGLEFSDGTADATLQVKDGDGIAIDSDGVNVDLGTVENNPFDTAHREAGCGLSLSDSGGTGKLRVKPLDFLYTAADEE